MNYMNFRDDAEIGAEVELDLYLHCLFHAEKTPLISACVPQPPKISRLYSTKPTLCQECGVAKFDYSTDH